MSHAEPIGPQVLATQNSRKHLVPPTVEQPAKRSKKGKKAKGGSKAAIPELNPSDYVRVVKVTNRDDLLHEGPVMLSKSDKAGQMTLSDDRMTVTSSKGYRMVCNMIINRQLQLSIALPVQQVEVLPAA